MLFIFLVKNKTRRNGAENSSHKHQHKLSFSDALIFLGDSSKFYDCWHIRVIIFHKERQADWNGGQNNANNGHCNDYTMNTKTLVGVKNLVGQKEQVTENEGETESFLVCCLSVQSQNPFLDQIFLFGPLTFIVNLFIFRNVVFLPSARHLND